VKPKGTWTEHVLEKKFIRAKPTSMDHSLMPYFVDYVTDEEEYQLLEAYINKLVDFACFIREQRPEWKREKS